MTANAGRPDLDHLLRASHIPPGEPIFYFRARDPAAFDGVLAWAAKALELGAPIAVVEQGLMQGERLHAFGPKAVPGAEHLTDSERRQLEYQFGRRAWRARLDPEAKPLAIALAERRGWDQAMAAVRLRNG